MQQAKPKKSYSKTLNLKAEFIFKGSYRSSGIKRQFQNCLIAIPGCNQVKTRVRDQHKVKVKYFKF
jgi:hypothetical protein